MHTLLSRFCEEFVRTMRPLLPPLKHSVEALRDAPDEAPEATIREDLVDLHHQLDLLTDKVAEQQAYILIFGPLKSGKSTLMNAIASSYVSEVSSLPAYPCMVFVADGRRRQYSVTHYNGTVKVYDDAQELQDNVDHAHTELAARVRENETSGIDFDPLHNFKSAIRRIDVRFPIAVLEPSKAVLVDTPGLYTRMKFGYDRMTRDFRNAAACAVFVVRSDNLFLDQVFAEFEKLLELFSRIFLVVNMDTRKQDVGPDGNLVPSLEQRDPRRVIEAFESLTMSAALKKAADEGRLRIYPVDLLTAASQRLKKAAGSGNGPAPEAEFERFFTELTDYLNSPDYLVAFLGDSLRRATTLLGEVKGVCDSKAIGAIRTRAKDLTKEREETTRRLRTVKRLAASEWDKGFEWLRKDMARVLQTLARDIDAKSSRAVTGKVKRWFETTASLDQLVQADLLPVLEGHQREIVETLGKELSERLVGGHAAIRISGEVDQMLREAEVDLGELGRQAHTQLDREQLVAPPPAPLRSEDVPVRRTAWDWVLFRRKAAIRRKLFGPDEAPRQAISGPIKAHRIGDVGRAEMARKLAAYEREFFTRTRDRVHASVLHDYTARVKEELRRSLREKRTNLEERLTLVDAQHAECRRLLEPLGQLDAGAGEAQESVRKLADHYGQLDVHLLTKPVLPDYTLPPKTPTKDGKDAANPKKPISDRAAT